LPAQLVSSPSDASSSVALPKSWAQEDPLMIAADSLRNILLFMVEESPDVDRLDEELQA
jgi:hypothetical protein